MAERNGSSTADTIDFARMTQDMYAQWESAMTSWWDQVLDSPDFLGATGKGLSQAAGARRSYEKAVDEGLGRLHLPTRADLVRVARIATLLEERLLQVEDNLLAMRDQVSALEKETIQARVEAAEARLELRERLAAIQARLDAVEGAAAAPAAADAAAAAPAKPAPRKRAPRKRSTKSSASPSAKTTSSSDQG